MDGPDYGNEKECGQGVKRALDEGLVKREELFIASKLWNTFHEAGRVEPIARQQLEWWGLEYSSPFLPFRAFSTDADRYFDMFYIHFPVALEYVDPKDSFPSGWNYTDGSLKPGKAPIQETWQAMERLVDSGLARSIGVSNFQGSLLMDLLRYARVRPAVLQIEHHPYLVQPGLLELARTEGIAVTAYSSFGPLSFVELQWQKATDTPRLFEQPVIAAIAAAYNKTPAQVLLRWATQRGLAIIPKSNTPHRMLENLDAVSWNMTPEQLDSISALDRGLRFNNPPDYLGALHIFA